VVWNLGNLPAGTILDFTVRSSVEPPNLTCRLLFYRT
jgi:hypothetical protein